MTIALQSTELVKMMTQAIYPDLKDKVIFITGGWSGIGAAMVEAFAMQGAKVAFVSNEESAGKGCAERLASVGEYPVSFQFCDVKSISQLKACITHCQCQFGDIDVLINNAANDVRHDLQSFDEHDWDESINTNLRPFYFAAQQVASKMVDKKAGSIINLSFNAALLAPAGYPVYVTAKAAIMGLTRALARELGDSGIRVNALVPGWVMTEKQKRLWVNDKDLTECLNQQCIGETLQEQDIVNGALFLASDVSRLMTGQNLVIDGGRAL